MNFFEFLNRQKTEDRRAFIVCYKANSGKTAFAKQVAEAHSDVYYLDLQAYALKHPDLLVYFDFSELENFLLTFNVDESVILVDNMDFLINTWGHKDKDAFENWLKIQLRSPGMTEKTFVFFMQNDSFLGQMQLLNSRGEARVIPLNSFESL
jgi:hypothetical protein